MTKDTRRLERELLKNDKEIEELIDRIGEINEQFYCKIADKKRNILEGELNKIAIKKVKLEKEGEGIVQELCLLN